MRGGWQQGCLVLSRCEGVRRSRKLHAEQHLLALAGVGHGSSGGGGGAATLRRKKASSQALVHQNRYSSWLSVQDLYVMFFLFQGARRARRGYASASGCESCYCTDELRPGLPHTYATHVREAQRKFVRRVARPALPPPSARPLSNSARPKVL